MIPRLQRFYGGRSIVDWLDLPSWLFWTAVKMMPVLHARESVHRINEMMYAQGNMKKEHGSAFIDDLQRIAAMAWEDRQPRTVRPASMQQMKDLTSGIPGMRMG